MCLRIYLCMYAYVFIICVLYDNHEGSFLNYHSIIHFSFFNIEKNITQL